MEFNDLQQTRYEKLRQFQAAGIDPFPARVPKRTHTAAALQAAFDALLASQATVTIMGRLRTRRVMGKSSFAHIADDSGSFQVFLSKRDVGDEAFDRFVDLVDLGDFVAATGYVFITKTGEPSVHVTSWTMLSKTLTPPPDKREGQFSDSEARQRQRYIDLAANPAQRETFRIRARLISAMRRYLDEQGFLEVETPVLQPIYGGAAARPFKTHHNQLHQDLFLRVATELYLKRLIVGGFDGVYEIGKDFRNEGVDRFHNPEFTMLEVYQAFADYTDMMTLTEGMVAYAAEQIFGTTTLDFQGTPIELAGPWPRITMRDAIHNQTGVDIRECRELESLREAIREAGLKVEYKPTWAKQVDELFSECVEPTLIQPTFITEYPQPLSPLAKRKADDPMFVERFELFAIGAEFANAFSELNDPIDQEQRFLEQGRDYAAGDDEAMQMDTDFLEALKVGMPPTGGMGIGIDRLVMLFTNQTTIREVILFPHLRRAQTEE
ncbi:MAG: lysine--tRNA ligase [Herpetosiphonaceae bacterium]|nr:lysine--tRNA ligase [Herpetosiphonaceae bacterium]